MIGRILDGLVAPHQDEASCRLLDAISSTLKDAETGQRGYLITGQDKYLEPYTAAVAGIGAAIDNVATLTSDNAAQQQRIASPAGSTRTAATSSAPWRLQGLRRPA